MAVNLSLMNVPDALIELLRKRATRNGRSLQRELLNILEAAVAQEPSTGAMSTTRAALTIDELAEIARKLFPRGTESSVDYLRQLRGRG